MLELGGTVVSVLDRLDREDVRLLPLRRVSASAVGLRWVRRQHSSTLTAMHLLDRFCVIVGIFLKLHATFPNSGIQARSMRR